MQEYLAIESTLGNSAAGFVAIVLFVGAYILNEHLSGKRLSPFLVLPLALAGSFMLYASTWSQAWANGVRSALNGVGGVFGIDDMPTNFIFGMAVIIAVIVVAVDLSVDPQDNPAAVWSLFIAPVAAHGASGNVGAVADGFFGGMALAIIEAVKSIFGG